MIVSFQKGVAIPLIGSEVGQMRTALVRLDNWGETPAPSNKRDIFRLRFGFGYKVAVSTNDFFDQ